MPCIGKTLDLVKATYIGFHWALGVHLKILTLGEKKIPLKKLSTQPSCMTDLIPTPPPTLIGFVTKFLRGTREGLIQVAVQWYGEQTPALPAAPS